MRIRTLIFLLIIGLGLTPMFIMISLNMPRTVNRFERAAQLESQALSQASFTRLEARIRCIKKGLLRSASLPYARDALSSAEQREILRDVLVEWFNSDLQVAGVTLYGSHRSRLVSLERTPDGILAPGEVEEIFPELLAQAGTASGDQVISALQPESAAAQLEERLLHMAVPVHGTGGGPGGTLVMDIDLGVFLADYHNSAWIDQNGEYLRGCLNLAASQDESQQLCSTNAFSTFSALERSRDAGDPVLAEGGSGDKTAWLPISFGNHSGPVMWVGSRIDESSIRSWKRYMMLNVLTIASVTALVVFFLAGRIASRIEAIRVELLEGLNRMIGAGDEVAFSWQRPRELKLLGVDLKTLSVQHAAALRERNKALTARRESEEKFSRLAAAAQDAILLLDGGGRVVFLNRAAIALFGYAEDEILFHPIIDLVHFSGGAKGTQGLLDDHSLYDAGTTLELDARGKNETAVPVEVSFSSLHLDGAWHGIWILRDISQRRLAEEKERQQQRQLQQADKMISLGLLVSGVAHEINNPNSIALQSLPLLARTWESVKPILDEFYAEHGDFTVAGIEYSTMRQAYPKLCAELEESSGRIREIVRDLKDYARQEPDLARTAVDINGVVRSGIRLTANSVHKVGARLSFTPGESLPPVLANGQRLTQVVINLIQNSCDALTDREVRHLDISTSHDPAGGWVQLRVADSGEGIDPLIIDQITDPFFTTKRSRGGTGLGLSVSAGIIRECEGKLAVESTPGAGTTVRIVLPVSHPVSSTEEHARG